jgi:hypothetical protein
MTKPTKAERLAEQLDLARLGEHIIPFICSAAELRRLSPMESAYETCISMVKNLSEIAADKDARVKELEGALNAAIHQLEIYRGYGSHDKLGVLRECKKALGETK